MSPEDLRRAREWGYDIWAVPYESLAALAYNVLVSQPEMEALTKLDRTRLWRFVTEVSRRYPWPAVSQSAPRGPRIHMHTPT